MVASSRQCSRPLTRWVECVWRGWWVCEAPATASTGFFCASTAPLRRHS
jgi:hypothetical protein